VAGPPASPVIRAPNDKHKQTESQMPAKSMVSSCLTRAGSRAFLRTLLPAGMFLVVTALPGIAPEASAQSPVEWDVGREQVTRTELENLLERIRENLASAAYSGRIRSQLEQSASMITRRLEEGDFQVGDRVLLQVEGEPEMSDTLVVRSGQLVSVPVVGDLSLRGVLRSELEPQLADHIGRYVREPRIRAQALIRISVIGEVESPGFFVVPAEMLVTDVLMIAGGPTPTSKLDDLRIERGTTNIWEGELFQEAVIQGRTLDHLNVQAGDRIVVPRDDARSGWDRFQVVVGALGAIGSVVFLVTQVF
jgi:protein involved in polysaccharide export with SLBB domain